MTDDDDDDDVQGVKSQRDTSKLKTLLLQVPMDAVAALV
jgi:hypothetical protein